MQLCIPRIKSDRTLPERGNVLVVEYVYILAARRAPIKYIINYFATVFCSFVKMSARGFSASSRESENKKRGGRNYRWIERISEPGDSEPVDRARAIIGGFSFFFFSFSSSISSSLSFVSVAFHYRIDVPSQPGAHSGKFSPAAGE